MKTKNIIFVTGGVISSLGKGIIAASLGRLLKDQNIKVNIMKCDPYLNVDAGTMGPLEHGEVFVTKDGGETDLDLGHYERFLNQDLLSNSCLTSGKIYKEILEKERKGQYLGKTVQIIPHVTDLIKEKIYQNLIGYDLLIVEIGGCVGDIESLVYLETVRQIKFELEDNCLLLHVGYLPFIKVGKELKTKPIQRSVGILTSIGLIPDLLITRSEFKLTEKELNKLVLFCNVKKSNIFQVLDLPSVYMVPLVLKEQALDKRIATLFNLILKPSQHIELKKITSNLTNSKRILKIAIVGKYTALEDAYLSIVEALKHAGIYYKTKIKYDFINARTNYDVKRLKEYNGILVPGGFSKEGINGKLKAIKYARENNIPFLGICLGLQLAVLEFAKNVCKLNVYHGEFSPNEQKQIISLMENQKLDKLGGTLRLGNYECKLNSNTLTRKILKTNLITERHRHRYEVNPKYLKALEKGNLVIAGIDKQTNLIEIIEYPKNNYFIATQFHPEFSSKLTNPNKFFLSFIKAAINN